MVVDQGRKAGGIKRIMECYSGEGLRGTDRRCGRRSGQEGCGN